MAEIVAKPGGVNPVAERVIIKTDNADVVIDYDAVARKASVVSLSETEKELKAAQERLSQIPSGPTDEELLAWARENYPMMDYSRERAELERVIAECKSVLSRVE